MRCGGGNQFDINKLQFHKIIALADADVDGKHIEALIQTIMGSQFKPIIERGMFYINVTPLYRAVAPGRKPVYLRDEIELDRFYNDEIASHFDFINDNGNKLKNTLAVISAMRLFKETVEEYSQELQVDANMFERVILNEFDSSLNFNTSGSMKNVKVHVIDTEDGGEDVEIKGFHNDPVFGERFVYINYDIDQFADMIQDLEEILKVLKPIQEVVNDKGKRVNVNEDSLYNISTMTLNYVSKKFNITRFKG